MTIRAGTFCLLSLLACCSRSAAPAAQTPQAQGREHEPEQQQEQEQAELDSSSSALTDSFARAEFANVIAACQSLQADVTSSARALCVGLAPASLYALDRDAEALLLIAGACGRMPPAGAQSDARAGLVALVMVGLADASRNGHFQRDASARAELLSSWLHACQVSESDVKNAVDRMTGPPT